MPDIPGTTIETMPYYYLCILLLHKSTGWGELNEPMTHDKAKPIVLKKAWVVFHGE